ncbi:MAG: hypothetical protein C4335_06285 [Armatimonadota bacterium]
MKQVSHRQYRNPRILEAVCEWQFATPTDWNVVVYGAFYSMVKDLGFQRAEQIPSIAVRLDSTRQQTDVTVSHILVRYTHENERLLLHLGPDSLTVNHLAPYPGWETFKPQALLALEKLIQLVPSIQIRRAILRYINHFEFPSTDLDVAEWFTAYLVAPDLGVPKGTFLLRQEYAVEPGCVLSVTSGLAHSAQHDRVAVLLDLEYQMLAETVLWGMEQMDSSLEKAHEAIYAAFESSITERARTLLEEVQ